MKEQPSNTNRRKFDEDFKQSALKMIDHGQSVRSVAQGLGVSENLLHKWKSARHANRFGLEAENAELRARLRQVEQERDILKNVWLRRRSQPRNESSWHKAGRMQQMYPASVL